MTSINWTRVLLGGLVAGVIVDLFEGVLNGVVLAQDWADAMKALGRPEISPSSIGAFNLMGLGIGIFAIWLYAAILARFGAGPKTAVGAGLATWIIGYLLPSIPAVIKHFYPRRLVAIGLAVGSVEIILASLAGARLYNEDVEGSLSATRAARA